MEALLLANILPQMNAQLCADRGDFVQYGLLWIAMKPLLSQQNTPDIVILRLQALISSFARSSTAARRMTLLAAARV
jgi:hypothetical protein